MGGKILPWARRGSPAGGWTNDDLAELYRVEHSLVQAGVIVETEAGLSDEGDPWFIFCHADGHVVVHTARIDGRYHLYCTTLPAPLTGKNFAEIAKTFVTMIAKTQNVGLSGRVVAHPSALLSLLVAAAVLSVDGVLHNSAQASELSPPPRNHLFAQNPAPVFASDPMPAASKTTTVKEVADIFFSAVWRDLEGSGEREAVWRAVEGAAVGLCALSGAFPFAGPLMELSRTELTPGVQPLPEGAETPDKFPDRPMLADAVNGSSLPVEAGGFTEGGIVKDAALLNLTPRPFQRAIDAPTHLTFEGVISPEETVTYATPSGARWCAEEIGASTSPQVNTLISSQTLSLNSIDGALLLIDLTPGGETINLDRFRTGSVSVMISGGGALTVTHAGALQSIEIASGVKAKLTLSYDETQPTTPSGDPTTHPTAAIDQTLKLDGATEVSVATESTPSASTPYVNLVVESQGAQTNTLNLVDGTQGPPTDFNITAIGTQNLVLNEPAASAISSKFDASLLTGKLMLSIEFGSLATDLSFGSANFIVTPEASIAIENLSGHPSVDLAIDLSSILFQYSATTSGPVALSINLGSLSTNAVPITIGSISADVNDLSVNSLSSDNTIDVITDHALANLTLRGSTPLEIASIQGITANDPQAVVIDAETLAGTLTLNASAINDTVAGGRQVEIVTGSGASTITDTNLSQLLSLTIGAGNAIVNMASGAAHVTISHLKGTDQVNVGSGGIVDSFTNGLHTILAHQSAIDASANLMEAATMAGSVADSGAAHQALLFSYRGNTYVFVDALGNHVFDPSSDAIVHLVGVTSSTELSGVFHSA